MKPIPGLRDADEVEAAWRAAAEELGSTLAFTPSWGMPIVQVALGPAIVTLELLRADTGFRTRVRAPFHDPDRTSLAVSDEGFLDSVLKTLGFVQDIELGRADFDDRFVAKGFPASRVRALLAPPVVDLIVAQAFLDLRVSRWTHDVAYPEGVSELIVQRSRIVREPRALVGMVAIARELLPRLDPLGGVADDGFDLLVARLDRPGGTLVSPWSQATLFDGGPARREAARKLGREGDLRAVPPLVAALSDADDELVVEAVRALATLGDPRAIPPLVTLLGRRGARVDGQTVAGHAGAALDRLGEGALVDAFERALEGDATGLSVTGGHLRAELAKALMEVLDSFDLEARIEAATALGELGAREALPLLRDKTRGMGLRTKLTEASRAAIAAIEARASLPRPAAGNPAALDTLPRPAGDAGGTDRTLPRPSQVGLGGPDGDSDTAPRSPDDGDPHP